MNPISATVPHDLAPPRRAGLVRTYGQPGVLGAYLVLAGTLVSLIGISWDVQWHVDVGPDTFFTLSHLLLYSGSAVAGLTSLVMVVRATAAQRAGRPAERAVGGSPVRVFGGTFTAPLGYLVAGTGGALFLLYGLLDLWWHSLYGFDAVLDSPPHVGLFVSISLTMVGSVIVFAAARAERWGRVGLIVSIPVLMTFSPITTNAFAALPLPFEPVVAGTVFFAVLLVIMGGLTLGRGAVLAISATLAAIQGFLWWFSPWASHVYAASQGLPLRDNLGNQAPELPASIPMFMLLAAAVIETLLWLGSTRGWSNRWLPQLLGASGGLVISVSVLLQKSLLGDSGTPDAAGLLAAAVVGLAFGALAGFLGARFAVILRANTPTSSPEGN
ncbi:hypothetical protein ACFRMN_27465 [Streptomyces sp. NPDC056835]|uniref:hypothetical protein n=1 Tax=Streptomyces sp. NPDC056835 TaxID=3345956 RepID=UPI0036B457FE